VTSRIYLDNAATSWPKPPAVARAVADFLTHTGGAPGRGEHRGAVEVGALLDRLRLRLADMTGCAADRVILNSGATEGLNAVIGGLLATRPAPTGIVTTEIEHNSVRRALHGWLAITGARPEIIRIPCDTRGYVSAAATVERARGADAIVITAASNVLGTVQPVAEIGRALARENSDTLLIVDAAQTAGLLDHNLERDGIDALVFSGHKALLGPPGTGALCLSERLAAELAPTRFGGTGADSEDIDMPAAGPARFEPGTPNTPGHAGLLAAMESVPLTCSEVSASHQGAPPVPPTCSEVSARQGAPPASPTGSEPTSRLTHERAHIRAILRACAHIPIHFLGIEDPLAEDPVSPATPRTGVISFTADGWSPTDLAAALDASFGIAVRAGLHCAPDTHKAMGTLPTGGAVRVSVGPYTTDAEIESLIDALRQLLA
jgi:cysteine desulfurase/selenocysteine lyase